MNAAQLETIITKLPAAKLDYPFGPDVRVFKVMGKMFALISANNITTRITLKAHPADVEILTSQFESIQPGYSMNKRHWITIFLDQNCPISLLPDMIQNSYDLVVEKLAKRDQMQLTQL
ncbi:MAG: MmcQ/YjbR family DNA-binding protein [Gammaproteobacteria bacterium]|nr:MmcQ/YjbR family DNA-binding protein [Gammaproteobacteria bacterium]MDH5728983.1 MmcQ/YjbR family DNA-binding protein [Gammaproteobacteria bacterium]